MIELYVQDCIYLGALSELLPDNIFLCGCGIIHMLHICRLVVSNHECLFQSKQWTVQELMVK